MIGLVIAFLEICAKSYFIYCKMVKLNIPSPKTHIIVCWCFFLLRFRGKFDQRKTSLVGLSYLSKPTLLQQASSARLKSSKDQQSVIVERPFVGMPK
jgi:hypothetical protein